MGLKTRKVPLNPVSVQPQQMVIDLSGRGGLVPSYQGDKNRAQSDPQLRYLGADNAMAEGFFNPFVRDGYLSPSNQSYKRITPTGSTASFINVPRAFTQSSYLDPDETFMLAGNRLWQAAGDDFTTLSSDATDINVDQQAWPGDILMYFLNGGTAYPFFTKGGYNSSLNGALTYYNQSADTYTNAQSSIFTDDYTHLVIADNGYMYMLDSTAIHKFDGTSSGGAAGIFTSNVIVFPGPYRTRGGIDYRGNLYVGLVTGEPQMSQQYSYRNNEITKTRRPRTVGVYVWDRLSTVVKMRDFFELPNMQNIVGFHIAPNGMLRVFGITNNRTVQLLEFNGKGFDVLIELGGRAYPAQPRGVSVSGLVTYWLGQDGIFYGFGKVNYTDKNEILGKLLDVNAVATAIRGSAATVSKAGAIMATGFYNTGQADTAYKLDHEGFLIGFSYSGGASSNFTVTIASPAVFTSNGHGLSIGDEIRFTTTGALPTGIATGTSYFVIAAGFTANAFQVSTSFGGSAANTSGSQSGTHSWARVNTSEVIRYFPHTNTALQSVTPVANQGNGYTKVEYFPLLCNLRHLNIYCMPGATTGSETVATIKLYANQSTSAFKTITLTRADITKGYYSVELNKLFVNALQIEIEWETTQQLGSNDFAPTFAVISYVPTSTLK